MDSRKTRKRADAQENGRDGGFERAERHSAEKLSEWASLGGEAVLAKYGPDYFVELRKRRKHYPKYKEEAPAIQRAPRLPGGREAVSWEKVLQLLVVNRWIDPGSEWRVHRQWFLGSAMDELLGVDFAVAEKDRLYRCLDRILEHKQELFVWLKQQWADLFRADFEVLLDLTSTYFEGEMEENPKAKHGYSRDGRPDCLQVVIALVITPDGFPLAYEVMDGNTSDRTTLRGFLDKIENTYGQAKRMWVMDRGIPSEAILAEMRNPARPMSYLVGTGKIKQYEKKWLDLPWHKVRDSVEVKLFEQDGELYVLAKSEGRQRKETAMRRKRLARLLRKLRDMRAFYELSLWITPSFVSGTQTCTTGC